MTAVSIAVQDPGVCILSDTAYYDGSGTVIQFRSKVTIHPGFRIAIAVSGCADRNRIATRLEAVRSQAEALAKLSSLVQGVRAENDGMNPDGIADGYNDVVLLVGIWSERTDRPEAWAIASSSAWLGSGYAPYSLVPIEQAASPPVPRAQLQACGSAQAAAAILAHQRAYVEPDGCAIVGGAGEMTIVHRTGVDQRTVCEWGDALGAPIDRDRKQVFLA